METFDDYFTFTAMCIICLIVLIPMIHMIIHLKKENKKLDEEYAEKRKQQLDYGEESSN